MLNPGERHLLADALRPPPGYRFDRAVTTTFTLDLLTLLTIPVAFTLYRWSESEQEGKLDPLALLEAVRRHAGRIHVFCQAGRIAVPRHSQLLFGYLEGSVIEVSAPKGGVFHPKVTVLRFTADQESDLETEEAPTDSTYYRMLCASRNLTFDRSWDTLLVLDGRLDDNRVRAFRRNRPLSQFVAALPGMAMRPVDTELEAGIEQIADELLRVRFEPPDGFDDVAFWPLGLDERRVWPFETRTDRILAVAPFADKSLIDRIADETEELHLVSRIETMNALPAASLERCDSLYTLDDSAQTLEPQREPDDDVSGRQEAGPAPPEQESIQIEPSDAPLRGLHAKLFVADSGRTASIWTGSANATAAAFERNVEFLVELTGRRSRHGVRALLREEEEDDDQDRNVGFRDLLVPYRRIDGDVDIDPITRELDALIDQARSALAEAQLVAHVSPHAVDDNHCYDVAVEATNSSVVLPPEVSLLTRPVNLPREEAVQLTSLSRQPVAQFDNLTFEALTGFLAFEATAAKQDKSITTGFVLNLPLQGAPGDRDSRLLSSLLNNRQRLLRYLLMLLADTDIDPGKILTQATKNLTAPDEQSGETTTFGLPLLEPLMRTLGQNPYRLKHVARLVEDLRRTEEGRKIVPAEFMAIWEPIWSASEEKSDA